MARTFFQDFSRDNGFPITVEYGVEGSYSPDTYSPRYGADGGDVPEFSILDSWPNTPAFEELHRRRNQLTFLLPRDASPARRLGALIAVPFLNLRIWWAKRAARLTDAEYERMSEWLAENYVEEPYEPEDYY